MELKLPDRTPPSPQAAAMTRYGGVDVNESSGSIVKTIPLHTYTSGNLSLPITLTYAGAGVKVDQLSEWTGINWTLNAGGVITRTINDQADEVVIPSKRIYQNYSELVARTDSIANGTDNAEFFSIIQRDDQVDSEVDIFSFSFAGYSGTFFLDGDFNAVLQKKESKLKIELLGTQPSGRERLYHEKRILVTTPDGIKYYFGGDYVEFTSVRTLSNGDMTGETSQGTTAFYLYEIEHPVNGKIFIEYDQNLNDKLVTQSKTLSKNKITMICGYICASHSPEEGANGTPIDIQENLVQTTTVLRVRGACYVERIYGGHMEILFKKDSVASNYPQRMLKEITVVKDSSTFKKIDLHYIVDEFENSQESRHFLTKIVFDDGFTGNANQQFGRRNEVYEFEYDSPLALPERFSPEQDMAGYYNGKPNSIYALPYNYTWSPFSTVGYADRFPDFQNAKKGTLTKIIYPTGGVTKIDYEAKPVKKNLEDVYGTYAYRHRMAETPQSFLENTWPAVDPVEGAQIPPTVPFNQDAIFYFNATCDRPGTFNPQNDFASMEVLDVTNPYLPIVVLSDTISFTEPTEMGVPLPLSKTRELALTLGGGKKYRVNISIGNGLENPMETSVAFKIISGYEAVDGYGVRVKRQTDFVKDTIGTTPESIRRYYYRKINDLNYNVADLRYIEAGGTISNSLHVKALANTNQSAAIAMRTYYKTLSTANIVDVPLEWEGKFATVSISYGGDNFEKGGIEKTFIMDTDFEGAIHVPILPPQSTEDPAAILYFESDFNQWITKPNIGYTSVLNGTLISEKTYLLKNNALHKQIEKEFVRNYNEGSSAYNLIVTKLYDFGTVLPTNKASNLDIRVMKGIAFQPTLDTIHTKTFIDPIPIGAPDESIYRSISQIETFEYNSHAGQPTKKTETTSEGSLVETRYFYPEESTTLPGSPSLQSWQKTAYDSLYARNVISKPIQIESYRGVALLSRTRTLYLDFDEANNGNFKFFPQSIHSAKGGNQLEERIVFHEYDGWGNPKLLSYSGGAKIFYKYNGRGQVVQKIENYIGLTPQPEIPEDYDANNLPPPDNNCTKQTSFPNSLVTDYYYDMFGNLLRIDDPRCRQKTFHYDARHKLIRVTEDDGEGGHTIIEDYDYNYKRY